MLAVYFACKLAMDDQNRLLFYIYYIYKCSIISQGTFIYGTYIYIVYMYA